jgi:RHS repeat-associated protein
MTDGCGDVVEQLGTFPFGEGWYNATNEKWLFTTYERDAESLNDYAMARSYVNRLGRFSSPDPLAGNTNNPHSLNRYSYVGNDPVNAVDHLGLGPDPCANDPNQCVSVTASDPSDLFVGFMFYPANPLLYELKLESSPYFGRGMIDNPPPPISLGPAPEPPPPPQSQCAVTPQSLDSYLASKNSPLAGQGRNLFNAGSQYNVDPRLIVALAGAETTFGTDITRGQFNAWNWQYNGPGNQAPFSSWAAGINAVTRGIGGPLYFGANPPLTTAPAIYGKYCYGAGCATGLNNLTTFLKQQGADPNSLKFPCKREGQ